MPIPNKLELESQLYAILKTLQTVHEDVLSGKIPYSAYCNIVRQKINDLMLVELTFQSKGIDFGTILDEMKVSTEFFSLIPQIQEFITLTEKKQSDTLDKSNLLNDSEKNLAEVTGTKNKIANFGQYTINPIRLANLASTITGSFITIFDFFKMELKDPKLLHDSFQRLIFALKEFPGLEELYLDVKSEIRKMNSQFSEENQEEFYTSFEKLHRRYLAVLKNPNQL
jgi:hypothetical protein